MKSNTTSKNNQGINTTSKALINPKYLQIYGNNHAFSVLINTKVSHKRDEWGFACKTVSTDFNATQVDFGG